MRLLKKLWHDESGVTTAEYGVLVAALVLAVSAVAGAFHSSLENLFQETGANMSSAAQQGGGGGGGLLGRIGGYFRK